MSAYQSHLSNSHKSHDQTVPLHQSHLHRNYKRADSDIERLYFQIRKVKYPVLAIQPAEHLQNKISHFKNEKLQNQMKQKLVQDKQLSAYRKIRGDGNCFIRALAYSYLSNIKDLSDVKATFYQLQDVDLTVCIPQSIPKEFRPFYNDKLLKQILTNNWQLDVKHFKNLCRDNNKRILSRMFRRSPYLDFIVILYFRSLCLKGLQKHKEQVKDFMKGTQEQEIKTYGQESEGVILDICSRLLKVAIDVYEVRTQDINHYGYRNQKILKQSFNVSLLYYENHYDIIQTIDPRLLDQQRNDAKIQEEQYYSKINEHMIQGNCIQCSKNDYIYEENYLCDNCFQISKQQMLNNAREDKWVRGTCRDCGRSGLKVLQMLSLCQACAKLQAQVTDQDIKKSSLKKTSYYCAKCSTELNQKEECPKCSTIQVGMCLQCDVKNYIDKETKLCRYCRNLQSQVYAKNEKKQQYLKNQCQNCKQQLDSYYHKERCLKKPIQICHYCNESKDSQVHQMKCVQKLTAGKITLPKTQKVSLTDEVKQQAQNRRCRKCNLMRQNQILVGGWCKMCRQYFSAEQRHKDGGKYFGSGSIISQTSHKAEGPRSSIGGQSCKGCKNHFYIIKLKDGYCQTCQPYYHKGYRL